MTYEEFLKFVPSKCVYETIYDDSDGRTILVIRLLDAFSMVNKAQLEQTNTRPYSTIEELNVWANEKQAWRNAAMIIGEKLSSVGPVGYYEMSAKEWFDWAMKQEPRGKDSLPPQREWVGLTNEEIDSYFEDHGWSPSECYYSVIKAIEARLKDKNT